MFQFVHKDVPIFLEVKDKSSEEAAHKAIALIRKYGRYHSTAIGSDSSKFTQKMLKYDPHICTLFGTADIKRLILGFFTGLLPYFAFDRDVAAMPYMTRDYLQMKKAERAKAQKSKWLFLTVYIYLMQVCNMCFNPVLKHLQRRGIFTCYWVLNQEGEFLHVARTSCVQAIMTDRPTKIKQLLELKSKLD